MEEREPERSNAGLWPRVSLMRSHSLVKLSTGVMFGLTCHTMDVSEFLDQVTMRFVEVQASWKNGEHTCAAGVLGGVIRRARDGIGER